jgi:hypothetical protein
MARSMSGGIFLRGADGKLDRLSETPYAAEEILQGLLADYHDLLAGDQIDPENPRRWLLVRREVGVPADDTGGVRWSIDHLFLDQDAVPTLVEVKRSSDSRIRREVVGQMLDYAANSIVYWSPEAIREHFEAATSANGKDPDEVIDEFLEGGDPESFWQAAKHNLQAGRVRMIFVADVIPRELRRIVEFLNVQMDPAEVLAIEVRQFSGQAVTALVPQVVGQTAAARQAKGVSGGSGKQWDEASFFQDLEQRKGSDVAAAARSILEWARNRDVRIWWGKGKSVGSFFPMLDHDGRTDWTISVWTYGTVEIQFKQLARDGDPNGGHPFASAAARMELRDRLNAIEGVSIPESGINRRPNIPLERLVELAQRERFLQTLDWLVDRLLDTSTVANPV